uniref:Uncharacterized protein n=1 Tax=Electrophorus electricus TaxID=8005 RepID=A0AAY5F352_ELEEL
ETGVFLLSQKRALDSCLSSFDAYKDMKGKCGRSVLSVHFCLLIVLDSLIFMLLKVLQQFCRCCEEQNNDNRPTMKMADYIQKCTIPGCEDDVTPFPRNHTVNGDGVTHSKSVSSLLENTFSSQTESKVHKPSS